MSLTEEENVALAKACGAAYGPTTDNICFLTRKQLGAYTSAIEKRIEQKYQAQIAMLVDVLGEIGNATAYTSHDDSVGYRVCCDVVSYLPHKKSCKLNAALSATQPTADAFIAEIEARALGKARDRLHNDYSLLTNSDYEAELTRMAAEKRKQAEQPQTKRKPCTCDGWCDGLCLERKKS